MAHEIVNYSPQEKPSPPMRPEVRVPIRIVTGTYGV